MIKAQNIKRMGTIATSADRPIFLNGLMTCVQFIVLLVYYTGLKIENQLIMLYNGYTKSKAIIS